MKDVRRDTNSTGNAAERWVPTVPFRVEPVALGIASIVTMAGALLILTWWLPGARLLLISRPATLVVTACTTVLALVASFVVLLAARVYRGFGGFPEDKAYARLRERIVPVRTVPIRDSIVVVDSASELRRISALSVAPIVHEVTPTRHHFAVVDESVTYLLTVPRVDHEQPGATTSIVITLPDVEQRQLVDIR